MSVQMVSQHDSLGLIYILVMIGGSEAHCLC